MKGKECFSYILAEIFPLEKSFLKKITFSLKLLDKIISMMNNKRINPMGIWRVI